MCGQLRCATGVVACVLLLCHQSAGANEPEGPPSKDDLFRLTAAAISTDAGTASAAVAQLRHRSRWADRNDERLSR